MKLQEYLNVGKTYIIAEMSANHAGSLENALAIVKAAKEAGADCLKLQTYTADTMTLDCDAECFRIQGGLWGGQSLFSLYKQAAFPWEWHVPIQAECYRLDIDFISTPFDATAVDFLEKLGVGAYKVASFELVDIPLIENVASKGKPVILSCGMASPAEIRDALDACRRQQNNQVVLLKCCSEYPANWGDMNLRTIPDMAQRFCVPVGLSDHSPGVLGAVVGVSLGAKVVEKHLCLSRSIPSADSAFSMEPAEFAAMVSDIRAVEQICGNVSYALSEKETASIQFRRSLFAVRDIARGEVFTTDNVRSIRPNDGLPPALLPGVLGKQAKTPYCRGEALAPFLCTNKQDAFSSERLWIRGLQTEDTENIIAWRGNPDVYRFFKNPHAVTAEEHVAWFAGPYQNDYARVSYLLFTKTGGVPIGMAGVRSIDLGKGSCELEYIIGNASYLRKGYAVEALRALIIRYVRLFGLSRFVAVIHPENHPSLQLSKRLGFQCESTEDGFLRMVLVRPGAAP